MPPVRLVRRAQLGPPELLERPSGQADSAARHSGLVPILSRNSRQEPRHRAEPRNPQRMFLVKGEALPEKPLCLKVLGVEHRTSLEPEGKPQQKLREPQVPEPAAHLAVLAGAAASVVEVNLAVVLADAAVSVAEASSVAALVVKPSGTPVRSAEQAAAPGVESMFMLETISTMGMLAQAESPSLPIHNPKVHPLAALEEASLLTGSEQSRPQIRPQGEAADVEGVLPQKVLLHRNLGRREAALPGKRKPVPPEGTKHQCRLSRVRTVPVGGPLLVPQERTVLHLQGRQILS